MVLKIFFFSSLKAKYGPTTIHAIDWNYGSFALHFTFLLIIASLEHMLNFSSFFWIFFFYNKRNLDTRVLSSDGFDIISAQIEFNFTKNFEKTD